MTRTRTCTRVFFMSGLVFVLLIVLMSASAPTTSAKISPYANILLGDPTDPDVYPPQPMPDASNAVPGAVLGGGAPEYFQLTLPLSNKPKMIRDDGAIIQAIVLNAYVDHSLRAEGNFYDPCGTRRVQIFTGEEGDVPADISDPCNPGAFGQTPNGRNIFYNGHPGIDFEAKQYTPVYASHAGIVQHLRRADDPYNVYGNAIQIRDLENPGLITLYAHLDRYRDGLVRGETRVARGEFIGWSGDTDSTGAPHLHWGVYIANASGAPAPTAIAELTEHRTYVLDPHGWFSYKYDALTQRTPDPAEFKGIIPNYRWASGYAPATPANAQTPTVEPINWNLGTLQGNAYVDKNRVARPPQPIGPGNPGSRVNAIERIWANSYGNVGAPYAGPTAVYNADNTVHHHYQFFEGGTISDEVFGGQSGAFESHFRDVSLTHWALRYIGWVNTQGVVGGVECGTRPNEPCDDVRRPYYRPDEVMTRQQFSKFVSNLFGFVEDPGDPIFTDVTPDNNVFYQYINRLARRGILGGYPCGEQGEPCDAYRRPYFRPTNNVSRGQAAKIVANTADTANWLVYYSTDDGPDFFDVPKSTDVSSFYPYVQKLYKAGVIRYRLEESGKAGQGGNFFVDSPVTRAQMAFLLHELVYASVVNANPTQVPPGAPPANPGAGTPTPCTLAAEPVVWGRYAPNVTVISNSIRKTSGGVGWGDAGAVSTKALLSGPGYMEATAASRLYHVFFGLGNGDSNQSYTDLEFAFHLQGTSNGHPGDLKIYESGVEKVNFGPIYNGGDVFRIEITEAGQVVYSRNGNVIYVSTRLPVYPLVVDSALYHLGAEVLNARIRSCSLGNSTIPTFTPTKTPTPTNTRTPTNTPTKTPTPTNTPTAQVINAVNYLSKSALNNGFLMSSAQSAMGNVQLGPATTYYWYSPIYPNATFNSGNYTLSVYLSQVSTGGSPVTYGFYYTNPDGSSPVRIGTGDVTRTYVYNPGPYNSNSNNVSETFTLATTSTSLNLTNKRLMLKVTGGSSSSVYPPYFYTGNYSYNPCATYNCTPVTGSVRLTLP